MPGARIGRVLLLAVALVLVLSLVLGAFATPGAY